MEFTHPFPHKKPGEKLTKQEIISALRLGLSAEQEATHLYDTIAEYTTDARIKHIMTDIANEEQVHIGEIQHLLNILEEDEIKRLKQGDKEAKQKLKNIKPEDIAQMIEEEN